MFFWYLPKTPLPTATCRRVELVDPPSSFRSFQHQDLRYKRILRNEALASGKFGIPKNPRKNQENLPPGCWNIRKHFGPEVWVKRIFFHLPQNIVYPPRKTNLAGWKTSPWMSRCIAYWKWGIFQCYVSFQGFSHGTWKWTPGKVLLWNHPFQASFLFEQIIQGVCTLWALRLAALESSNPKGRRIVFGSIHFFQGQTCC